MSSKTVVLLEDDTDGSQAVETVYFAVDGASYEIDLSEKNASKLRDTFAPYVAKARKTGKTGRHRGSARMDGFGMVDTKAVRKWAEANDVKLNSRGRIPADVMEQYRAAST
jgi:ribosome assembly protein YihI (activator of Der GTPase)